MSVQLPVNVTDEQYRALLKIASKRSVQAHHLVEQLVTHALKPAPAPVTIVQMLDDIRRLHGLGKNDRQIAENLGVKQGRVSYQRNQMHLPVNDPRGRKSQEKAH
ncbi:MULTISPECIES: hypothetical protein [Cryobacterium]|uniref:DNA-binding protein n=1 Tax=Cryobacterium breve TaxID=1259258 RepID=A0ABY2J4D2_9MICO|nr:MULTISPECIES: hypothetical protein [Cryobacterium]TFC92064.1 hypothetical protein E3T20_12175 [Cryobacterium sp. TmT3-12]TFC99797.1 hypothetical protein E3O65_05330 [Cryobacterium breve]